MTILGDELNMGLVTHEKGIGFIKFSFGNIKNCGRFCRNVDKISRGNRVKGGCKPRFVYGAYQGMGLTAIGRNLQVKGLQIAYKGGDEMDKNQEVETPEKGGVYTPLKTPEDIGQLSGGEWNFEHSSDSPIQEE